MNTAAAAGTASRMNPHQNHRDYRQPPARKSMHARIVRNLGMRIVGGEFAPGDRLPAEAVRVLVAKGLVLSRQRAGAIVRPRNEWHLLDPDVLYWLIQSQPPQQFVDTLLTVRRVFEPAIAALAARVASEQALQDIAEAYSGMETASTPDELLEPDLAFHRRIAEATGNDLLAYIGNMLSLALRESIKLSSQHPNTHALSLPRHRAILTALMNRDPLGAQQATLVQLAETREDLSAIFESGGDAGPAVAQRAAR